MTKKVEELSEEFKAEIALRNAILERSKARSKALHILIPLISKEDIVDLLSELYDLRLEKQNGSD